MARRTWVWLSAGAAVIAAAGWFWYSNTVITGIVYDGLTRLEGARVRFRGTNTFTLTDKEGRFRLFMPAGQDSVEITAWKDMYFISGMKVGRGEDLVLFKLRTFLKEDNPRYQWIRPHPDPGSEMACANCHEQIYAEWKRSTHSRSATNPHMIQLFLGTDAEGNKEVGPGHHEADRGCAGCP